MKKNILTIYIYIYIYIKKYIKKNIILRKNKFIFIKQNLIVIC